MKVIREGREGFVFRLCLEWLSPRRRLRPRRRLLCSRLLCNPLDARLCGRHLTLFVGIRVGDEVEVGVWVEVDLG